MRIVDRAGQLPAGVLAHRAHQHGPRHRRQAGRAADRVSRDGPLH